MLVLTLEPPPGPARVREPVPVGVRLTNRGEHAVRVVGVVDGSETGTRYPHYLPLIEFVGTGGAPTVAARPGSVEDPLVGPLQPDAAVLLEPGASFDPTDPGRGFLPLSTFATFRPGLAGLYRWSLTFDTTAPPEAWLGRFGQDPTRQAALARAGEVPRVRLDAALELRVQD